LSGYPTIAPTPRTGNSFRISRWALALRRRPLASNSASQSAMSAYFNFGRFCTCRQLLRDWALILNT
jgi:hypothetical protein